MCCGTGRHSVAFAQRGLEVTGVDLNPAYLARAQGRAESEGVSVSFTNEDARTFVRPGEFDAAVNLDTSFGYFDDLADDLQMLVNLRRCLAPGGRLVIETTGKEVVARRGDRRSWFSLGDDTVVCEEKVLGAFERVELHWTRLRLAGGREDARMSIRLYSAVELASILREAGFARTAIFGSLSGAAYGPGASALVGMADAPG